MCTSFTINHELANNASKKFAATPKAANYYIVSSTNAAARLYEFINLEQYGLSEKAFSAAWKGYETLKSKNQIRNHSFLTICDFSQSSSKKRFYLIDVEKKKLVMQTYVAHGKNSGSEYATSFSNTSESLQSSLGFYVTAETYTGEHGLSLRLKGTEANFNSNAYMRSIVIHGAAYVDAARAKAGVMMGRSFGCPAVPQKESEKIINTIKNGSCLFIYNTNSNYLNTSKILND